MEWLIEFLGWFIVGALVQLIFWNFDSWRK